MAAKKTAAEIISIFNKKTQVSNAKFARMSDRSKRVAIAKDALRMLGLRAVVPTHGTYLEMKLPEKFELPRNEMERQKVDIREDILPSIQKCAVCAIGLAALAKFNTMDRAKVRDFTLITETTTDTDSRLGIRKKPATVSRIAGGGLYDNLEKYFPGSTLGQMESAFETDGSGKDPRAVLNVIFKNIIENKGDFIYADARLRILKCKADRTKY